MPPAETGKTLIQCDFDGTITEEDMGFMLMDIFIGSKEWRKLLVQYHKNEISVGPFNTKAFSMLKEDRKTLVNFIKSKVKVRSGFQALLDYCSKENFRFFIVSNGLDFYIEAILQHIGISGISAASAQTRFTQSGIEARYIDHEGNLLDQGFKESYVKMFRKRGYRVIYIGNGESDAAPAKLAHHIFACDNLRDYCREQKIAHTPFTDFNDVIKGLKKLK